MTYRAAILNLVRFRKYLDIIILSADVSKSIRKCDLAMISSKGTRFCPIEKLLLKAPLSSSSLNRSIEKKKKRKGIKKKKYNYVMQC